MMGPFTDRIPEDFSTVKWEQIRDEQGMPQVMWVENGEIKTAQANLYQCSICGEVNYYPEKPQHCLYCKKKASFKPFTPPEIKELWKPYGMEFLLHPIDDIAGEINKFLDSYLYLEDYRQLEVMTRWIIASYRQDQFQFAPYLQFIGPVESGKNAGAGIDSAPVLPWHPARSHNTRCAVQGDHALPPDCLHGPGRAVVQPEYRARGGDVQHIHVRLPL